MFNHPAVYRHERIGRVDAACGLEQKKHAQNGEV